MFQYSAEPVFLRKGDNIVVWRDDLLPGNPLIVTWYPKYNILDKPGKDTRDKYCFRVKSLKTKEIDNVGERSYSPPAY